MAQKGMLRSMADQWHIIFVETLRLSYDKSIKEVQAERERSAPS